MGDGLAGAGGAPRRPRATNYRALVNALLSQLNETPVPPASEFELTQLSAVEAAPIPVPSSFVPRADEKAALRAKHRIRYGIASNTDSDSDSDMEYGAAQAEAEDAHPIRVHMARHGIPTAALTPSVTSSRLLSPPLEEQLALPDHPSNPPFPPPPIQCADDAPLAIQQWMGRLHDLDTHAKRRDLSSTALRSSLADLEDQLDRLRDATFLQ